MAPTCTERLLQVMRVFALHPDHVAIRAKRRFRGRFESRAPLSSLRPGHTTIRIRYKLLRHPILASAAGVGVVALARYGYPQSALQSPLAWLGCLLVVGGVMVGLVGRQKGEHPFPHRRILVVKGLDLHGLTECPPT